MRVKITYQKLHDFSGFVDINEQEFAEWAGFDIQHARSRDIVEFLAAGPESPDIRHEVSESHQDDLSISHAQVWTLTI